MTPLLHMRIYEPIGAVVLALLVAVLAVRALGQTDLNPVSGVGKLSQVRCGPLCSSSLACAGTCELLEATSCCSPCAACGYTGGQRSRPD